MAISKRNAYIGLICLAVVAIFYPDSAKQDAQHRALQVSSTSRRAKEICAPQTFVIDFDKDAANQSIPRGTYISDQWLPWGVEVAAKAPKKKGYTPVIDGKGRPRIFDTSNPGSGKGGNGDPDLASDTLGNILIVQESDKDTPDDNSKGGWIDFYFTLPADIEYLDIMDVDGPKEKVVVTGEDGNGDELEKFKFSDAYGGDGHGKLTHQELNLVNVKHLNLYLDGSMAVAELKYTTTICSPEPEVVDPTPAPMEAVTPFPTPAPMEAVTPFPTDAPTLAPTDAPVAPPPTSSPHAGSCGDPIIMGLGGQIFKFIGRSGAWYSAVSTKSFQWNMQISKFEGCPVDSDTFTTGMGLTVFGKDGRKHQIEVAIVNKDSVYTGCGNHQSKDFDFGCLGAGSLQLVIDGHKVVQAFDQFLDEDLKTRVTAYNIISKCSRRWFDFDVTPADEIRTRQSRNLEQIRGIGIFETIDSLKETMIDKEGCRAWVDERRSRNDLLQQTGTWSTVIIKTEDVSFHIEYRQEMERCNAHNLDVWITEVSPGVFGDEWEGVVGETKTEMKHTGEKTVLSRHEVLKFGADEDYEVLSPFSTSCVACVNRHRSGLRRV